jgi:tetratricopeptide (TPR) repeat protein
MYLDAPGFAGGDHGKAEAEREAVRALDAGRGHAADALFLMRARRQDAAIAAFRAAIAANPADMDARYDLGLYLQQLERHDNAIDEFEAMLAHDPGEVRALYQIGKSAIDSRRHLQRAEVALLEYLKLGPRRDIDPSRADAHWRLGTVYEQADRREQARAQYAAALELDPGFNEARKALDRLGAHR